MSRKTGEEPISEEETLADFLEMGEHLPPEARAKYEQRVRAICRENGGGIDAIRELMALLKPYPYPPEKRARMKVEAFFRELFRTRAEIEADNDYADEMVRWKFEENRIRMGRINEMRAKDGLAPFPVGAPPVMYVMGKTKLPPLALPAPKLQRIVDRDSGA